MRLHNTLHSFSLYKSVLHCHNSGLCTARTRLNDRSQVQFALSEATYVVDSASPTLKVTIKARPHSRTGIELLPCVHCAKQPMLAVGILRARDIVCSQPYDPRTPFQQQSSYRFPSPGYPVVLVSQSVTCHANRCLPHTMSIHPDYSVAK